MGRRAKVPVKRLKRRLSPPPRAQSARLRALVRLNQRISSSLEGDQVLQAIAEAATELMDASGTSFWTVDAAAETLTQAAFSDQRLTKDFPFNTIRFDQGGIGWVAKHRQILDVPDVFADTRILALDWWSANKRKSFLGVPIVSGESLLAVLTLSGRTPFRLGPEERDLLDMFVTQAAAALRNARVFAESKARQRAAEALAEVEREIVSELNLDRLLDIIIAQATRVFEADGAIHLVEPDGSLVPRAWSRAWDHRDLQVPAGKGVVGRCAELGEGIVVNDYERWADAVPQFVAGGMTRAMGHALTVHNRLLGIIAVSRVGHDARPFDREEFAVLGSFANHAAIALENARLFEEATRQAARMRALAEVERLLSENLDSGAIAQRIVESLRVLLAVRVCTVYRLVEASGDLAALAVAGDVGPSYGPDIVFPSGTGVAAIAVREGRPVATPDMLEDPRVSLTPAVRARIEQASYRAVLALPLAVDGRVMGALGVGDRRGRAFRDEDVQLAQAFAAQAANALENARLYEDAQRREREAAILARVARELTESLEPDEVGKRIVKNVRQLVGAPLSLLHLVQPDGSLRVIAWSGEAPPYSTPEHPLPAGTGVSSIVVREGRPFWSSDLLNDPSVVLAEETRQALQRSGNRAYLGAPLRLKGEIIGSLTVGDKLGRAFSHGEVALLETFADHVAMVLVNTQLFAGEKAARAAAEASERALKESESRYRGLVEGSLQGVYIHKDSIIRFANPALARIFGYESPEEMIGARSTGLMAPHEVSRLEGYAAARLRGEPVPSRYEYEGVRRYGTGLWVEAAASVVPWEEERAFLVTVVDITERKRLEEELRQSQKMEAVGRLAGGVAHDFNNLLTVIIGRAGLALDRVGPEDPLRRDFEVIQKTAERGATVTQQLLAFSRKQVLQPKVLDLDAIVIGMETMLRRLIGEHIRLATVSGEEVECVKADPGQIEQVIMNLALNARDAMPGGGTLTIETANATLDDRWVGRHPGSRPGRYVRLTVTDTGSGLDEKAQAHLFEPFFTTKEIGKGTGLGLAMVYGIVKQSNGYIAVESAPGRGTSFEIHLPRFAEAAEQASRPSGGKEIAREQETILLVEDESDVRELARDVLSMAGYRVVEAATGGDAERLCREHAGPIHLLLTDVIMPKMGGRELAARLAGSRPGMRVLYMSGYTDDAISRHGVLGPGISFLPKPFTPADLARKVRKVLDASP